jgi:hypothetical protein
MVSPIMLTINNLLAPRRICEIALHDPKPYSISPASGLRSEEAYETKWKFTKQIYEWNRNVTMVFENVNMIFADHRSS